MALSRPSINAARQARLLASGQVRVEPFVLPRLAIDLDAVDNRNVRVEDGNLEVPYLAKEKAELEYLIHKYKCNMLVPKTPADRIAAYSDYALTAPDLMNYALLASPWDEAKPKTKSLLHLRKTFEVNGILPTDTRGEVVKHLANNFSSQKARQSRPQDGDDLQWVIGKFEDLTSLDSLKRLISMALENREACEMLAHGKVLSRTISNLRKTQESWRHVRISQILVLLNNLSLNLQSKGFDIEPHFVYCGIYYSFKARLNLTTTLTRYLEVGTRMSLPNRCLLARQDALAVIPDKADGLNLQLLTGWERGVPFPGETRKPSFGAILDGCSISFSDSNVYGSYIIRLALMQANDALWHEWKLQSSTEQYLAMSAHDSLFLAQSFTAALIVAGDTPRALEIIGSRPDFPVHPLPGAKIYKFVEKYAMMARLSRRQQIEVSIQIAAQAVPEKILAFMERLVQKDSLERMRKQENEERLAQDRRRAKVLGPESIDSATIKQGEPTLEHEPLITTTEGTVEDNSKST